MTAAVLPPRSSLLVPRPYTVVGKVDEAPGVVTLQVIPVEGDLPTFQPAQVSMLGAFGVGEAAISLSSSADETGFHAYTIRRAGPITNALVDTPVSGELTVRGPFGRPWPFEQVDTANLLIVAGGLGIAPLRAQIERAIAFLDRFDRLGLVFGARTPADLVFRTDLDRWRSTGAEVLLTVDHATPPWNGPSGFVTELIGPPGIELAWADTTAFLCGPDPMMAATAKRLIELGTDPNRIWITLERNMQCGNALCGHCQLGPVLVCRDGPVVNYADLARFHSIREL